MQIIRSLVARPNFSLRVTQAAHGFQLGQQIRRHPTTGLWSLAQADTFANLKMATVDPVSPDEFVAVEEGLLTWPTHGLNLGEMMYLDAMTPGEITNTAPVLSQRALFAVDDNIVRVVAMELPGEDGAASNQVSEIIDQANAFAQDDQVFYNAATAQWELAQADDETTLKLAHVSQPTANSFIAVYFGVVESPAHGFTELTYWLSHDTAGAVVDAPPDESDIFQQACFDVIDDDRLFVLKRSVVSTHVTVSPLNDWQLIGWVELPGHGFQQGEQLTWIGGGTWIRSIATDWITLRSAYCHEPNAEGFYAIRQGPVEVPNHGLLPGHVFYLSDQAAGAVAIVPPADHIFEQPVIRVIDNLRLEILDRPPLPVSRQALYEIVVELNNFRIGQAVYFAPNNTWQLAQADDAATLCQGVIAWANADEFVALSLGFFTWPNHGLNEGVTYHLSPDVAGELVEVPGGAAGTFTQAVLEVSSNQRVRMISNLVIGH